MIIFYLIKFQNQNKAEKERQRVEEIRKKDEKEKRREVSLKCQNFNNVLAFYKIGT